MYGSTGVSMRLRSIAPPNLRQVKRTVSLPKEARLRLAWMDYYFKHGHNAVLTCHHFGIAESCFYKWKKRYRAFGPRGLCDQPKRPHTVRQTLIPVEAVDRVRSLKKANPEISKYNLHVILKRDYGFVVSASSIGRTICRYSLFYTSPVKPKNHPQRRATLKRIRKPAYYHVAQLGDLIEVDVKHLPAVNGIRRYAFTAIDVVSKQATVHVASTISTAQDAVAWRKTVQKLGLPKAVLTDNGSEYLGAFAELLKTQEVPHYFARPYTPKDKPHIERFIGSLERECIQWGGYAIDLTEQQAVINAWLKKYHFYRPHQALGYLTPDEFLVTLSSEKHSSMS